METNRKTACSVVIVTFKFNCTINDNAKANIGYRPFVIVFDMINYEPTSFSEASFQRTNLEALFTACPTVH